jgi:hypothetical protein
VIIRPAKPGYATAELPVHLTEALTDWCCQRPELVVTWVFGVVHEGDLVALHVGYEPWAGQP